MPRSLLCRAPRNHDNERQHEANLLDLTDRGLTQLVNRPGAATGAGQDDQAPPATGPR